MELRQAIEAMALEYPRYGYRRVTAELARGGWHVTHKRVLRLMREGCLLVEVRRYCRNTTHSHHGYGRYRHLIKTLEIVL
jgi:putative transposase